MWGSNALAASAGGSTKMSATRAPSKSSRIASWCRREIDPGWLLSLAAGLLAAQHLLLWRFLDFAPWWLYPLAAALALLACRGIALAARAMPRPTLGALAGAAAVALLLYLLGGEGRLFYANADWQVRDAVLRDLTINSWPFIYQTSGDPLVLRAPLGMFLLPALVGKLYGLAAADYALLVQNSLLLTILLTLGSTLFSDTRSRAIALAVVVSFSGMDIVGQLLRSLYGSQVLPDHIERWAWIQFSSHVTQAFWVPQHALSGWYGALLFLLWKQGWLRLGAFFCFFPLLVLLSPLGMIGALPFALWAGLKSLFTRMLDGADILLPSLILLLSVPALFYLSAGGGEVGVRLFSVSPLIYGLFISFEILPYLAAIAALGARESQTRITLAIVALCLLLAPFVQIGELSDFVMRASITSLAILSVLVAQILTAKDETGVIWRRLLILVLAVGSVTIMFELRRSMIYRPSPRVQCSLPSAWDQVVELPITTKATYFAPLTLLPRFLQPDRPAIVLTSQNPRTCWNRPWRIRRSWTEASSIQPVRPDRQLERVAASRLAGSSDVA